MVDVQQPIINDLADDPAADNAAAGPAVNPAIAVEQPRAVPVKLPEFWVDEPELWFTQAEAQFRRGRVLDGCLRADYLLSALQPATLKSVRDILTDRTHPDTTLYARLRERLLRRFAATSWSLAFQVLNHPGIGDLKPSQLLDSMMALLPADEPAGKIFQALFLQRLPADMRDHLVAADIATPREMAVVADRMWDTRREKGATIAAARAPSPSDRGRERRRVSTARRQATLGPSSLCYYHKAFGEKAHRCRAPCTWSGQPPSGNVPAAGSN